MFELRHPLTNECFNTFYLHQQPLSRGLETGLCCQPVDKMEKHIIKQLFKGSFNMYVFKKTHHAEII